MNYSSIRVAAFSTLASSRPWTPLALATYYLSRGVSRDPRGSHPFTCVHTGSCELRLPPISLPSFSICSAIPYPTSLIPPPNISCLILAPRPCFLALAPVVDCCTILRSCYQGERGAIPGKRTGSQWTLIRGR